MACMLGNAHWLSIQSPVLTMQSLAYVAQPCCGVWAGAQPAGVDQLPIGLALEEGNILMPVIHKTLADGVAKLDCVAYIGQSLSHCVVLQFKGTNCIYDVMQKIQAQSCENVQVLHKGVGCLTANLPS